MLEDGVSEKSNRVVKLKEYNGEIALNPRNFGGKGYVGTNEKSVALTLPSGNNGTLVRCIQVGEVNGGGQGNRIYSPNGKSNTLSAQSGGKAGVGSGLIQVGEADLKGHDSIKRVYSPEGKSPTLTTMGGGHREPKVAIQQRPRGKNKGGLHTEKAPTLTSNSYEHNNHLVEVRHKSKCVRSSGRGSYDRHEWDSVGDKGTELHWRKLTPLECERLQTLPDNYTEGVSNTQRYKALGNGWTVDVIVHIYRNLSPRA